MTSDVADGPCLIVVGASAGGVEALTELVGALPKGLAAALAVVLHVAPSSTSVLPAILDRAGEMSARAARDGEAIEPGRVFVAPPDRHLVVEDGTFALRHGPRENGYRPAIDRLFSSAADAYGPRAVGVVLSGTLDDGAAGLATIKLRGGRTVVQDPRDALYGGMPANAMARTAVDHVCALADIAPLLVGLVGEGADVSAAHPDPAPHAQTPGRELDAGPEMPAGDAAGLSCPECGGALWYVIEGGTPRFRCRIGHVYSEESLLHQHGRSLEIALWTALRALEERAALLARMARRAEVAGHPRSAQSFGEQMRELDRHAGVIRDHIVPTATASGESAGLAARD
jgi:two-component system, chemotaxis family, protein-glutamate methylesterase/glutaminase